MFKINNSGCAGAETSRCVLQLRRGGLEPQLAAVGEAAPPWRGIAILPGAGRCLCRARVCGCGPAAVDAESCTHRTLAFKPKGA